MVNTFMSMEPGGGGPRRALTPILVGAGLIGLAAAIGEFFQPWIAAIMLGVLTSAVVCFVVLMAMPRATQISIMGAAVGVSADAGYAKLNDETPVTVANALVKMADALTKSVGIIAADAHVSIAEVTPNFVWAAILSMVVFMGLSFIVKHDG